MTTLSSQKITALLVHLAMHSSMLHSISRSEWAPAADIKTHELGTQSNLLDALTNQ